MTDAIIEQAARVLWDNNHLKLASVIDAGTLAQRLADAGLLRQEPPSRDEIKQARAEERERIARRLSVEHAKAARYIKTRYGQGQLDAYAHAARIARQGGAS